MLLVAIIPLLQNSKDLTFSGRGKLRMYLKRVLITHLPLITQLSILLPLEIITTHENPKPYVWSFLLVISLLFHFSFFLFPSLSLNEGTVFLYRKRRHSPHLAMTPTWFSLLQKSFRVLYQLRPRKRAEERCPNEQCDDRQQQRKDNEGPHEGDRMLHQWWPHWWESWHSNMVIRGERRHNFFPTFYPFFM